jgi:hypothetical protein
MLSDRQAPRSATRRPFPPLQSPIRTLRARTPRQHLGDSTARQVPPVLKLRVFMVQALTTVPWRHGTRRLPLLVVFAALAPAVGSLEPL